jgi:hypothetical protein
VNYQSSIIDRKLFIIAIVCGLWLIVNFSSCKKDAFITSPNASFATSVDTLHFDTVFTTTGSITQSFKIFNPNNQKLLLNNVQLMGGVNSFFKMNVDGTPGTSFSNISIDANDSLYVFVSVTINPNTANLPFIVQDSILITYNDNKDFVQLDAYGQNAHFLNNAFVTKDTTWTNDLPVVILGGVNVLQNNTLTINAGTRIYCHADAPINVNGTLNVSGGKDSADRVVFAGDRLDDPYKYYPGSWPGIFFNTTSVNCVLNYATIENAYQGIIAVNAASNGEAKVTLNQCIINNVYDAGILSGFSSINATNCLISNCGDNINIYAGGNYQFTNCTVATYGNLYISHLLPVLQISNVDEQNNTYDLNASFTNCIFYGDNNGAVNDEISVTKQGSNPFAAGFTSSLYKGTTVPANAVFNNCIANQDPLFNLIDGNDDIYDFHLQSSSPCIGAGLNTGNLIDLDGNPRTPPIDIGCYQHQ